MLIRRLRRRGAHHEGGGGEGCKKGKPQGDIVDPTYAYGRSDKEERSNSAGAEKLRRHHPVRVARSAQDADQTDSHCEKDGARRREEKFSHGRRPG